jgi:hypothetical protein
LLYCAILIIVLRNICEGAEQQEDQQDEVISLKKRSALFILGSKERFKLTQVATEGIVEGVTNLMQVQLE